MTKVINYKRLLMQTKHPILLKIFEVYKHDFDI